MLARCIKTHTVLLRYYEDDKAADTVIFTPGELVEVDLSVKDWVGAVPIKFKWNHQDVTVYVPEESFKILTMDEYLEVTDF